MNMMAPIPGMSLTKEPGNSPWEQPPLYDTPERALAFYFDKFEDEERLDDLLFAFESGYPIESMVDFLTSYSVMEGYHSVDVKMLISPLLHEYFVNLADAAGIEFIEELGPTKEERMKSRDKKRTQVLMTKALDGAMAAPTDESMEKAEEVLEEDAPLVPRRSK